MTNAQNIWYELLGTETGNRDKARMLEGLLDLMAKHLPALYQGTADISLDKAEIDQFLTLLQKQAGSPHTLRTWINMLARGINRGRTLYSWRVYPVPPARIIPRSRSHITPEAFPLILRARHLEELLRRDLEQPAPVDVIPALGQLLLAAILYGGLLSRQWLAPWVTAIVRGTIRLQGDLVWVDMEQPAKENQHTGEPVFRRWVADPLTKALVLNRYKQLGSVPASLTPLKCLHAYGKRLGSPEELSKLADLLACAELRLRLYLPPFLVDYAVGRIASVSLPPAVWTRVISRKGVTVNTAELPSAELPQGLTTAPIYFGTVLMHDQQKYLRRMLAAILPSRRPFTRTAKESRTALLELLHGSQKFMIPYLQLLVHWAIGLLTHQAGQPATSLSGRRLKPSSVLRYVQAIGLYLISAAGQLNPTTAEGCELQSLYEELLESIPSPQERLYACRTLAYFHEYLRAVWSVAPVDLDDGEYDSRPRQLGVDANLISPEIYSAALTSLRAKAELNDFHTMRVFVLMLGFRCGLRRSEIISLRVEDIRTGLSGKYVELIVHRNTKSGSSVRRLPLHELLSLEELTELLEWIEYRTDHSREKNSQRFLFSEENYFLTPVPEGMVFDVIEQVIRDISGDGTFRFHHLRHSFATWTLARIMLPRWTGAKKIMAGSWGWQRDFPEFSSAFTNHHGSVKQAPYLVAFLCGHASPDTTLFHYVHLCDYILGEWVSRPEGQPEINEKVVMHLLGVSRSSIYSLRGAAKSWQLADIMPQILKRRGKNIGNAFEEHTFPVQPVDVKPPRKQLKMDLPDWRILESVLRETSEVCFEIDQISNQYRLAKDTIMAWKSANARIAGLKTGGGARRHGYNDNGLLPSPVWKIDQDLVTRIFRTYRGISAEKSAEIDNCIKYFLDHFSVNTHNIHCQQDDQVQQLYYGLRTLEIPHESIRIHIYPGKKSNPDNVAIHACDIAELLRIPRQNVVIQKTSSSSWRQCAHATYGVKIVHEKRPQQNGKQSVLACYGFRYALALLGIARNLA